MRVTVNTKLVRRRSRLGMITSLAGIGVLAVGMIVSLNRQENLLWISLVALIVGFLLAQLGSYNLRRYARRPSPVQVLEAAMKGFDDRYHLYAWSLPAPFVLLAPQGLYVFVTRDQTGQVAVTGSTWRTRWTLSRVFMFFAQEGLGNPTQEAQAQAAQLDKWIKAKLPTVEVTTRPAIVFIDERVQLQVTEPTVPVMEAKGIKKWLRGAGRAETIKGPDFKALEALFDETTAAAQ